MSNKIIQAIKDLFQSLILFFSAKKIGELKENKKEKEKNDKIISHIKRARNKRMSNDKRT